MLRYYLFCLYCISISAFHVKNSFSNVCYSGINRSNSRNLLPDGLEVDLSIDLPSSSDLEDLDRQFGRYIQGLSPVFFTMNKYGRLVKGIDSVPISNSERPVLFVGNHQLYGADLAILIREFVVKRKTLIRGLAHPMIFDQSNQMSSGESGTDNSQENNSQKRSSFGNAFGGRSSNSNNRNGDMKNLFTKFGAVEVSPSSIFNLLRDKENVLLFPGGVREAYHGKDEAYQLFWPEKTDFVRMAGLFDTIIVPFSAIGIADSVNMIASPDDMQQLSLIANNFRKRADNKNDNNKNNNSGVNGNGRGIRSARPGTEETLVPPLSIPGLPSRTYFLFHEPVDTSQLNIYDKKATKEMYQKIKNDVQSGLWSLQKLRQNDPYKDFVMRFPYEMMTGKQAPTAPLNIKV